MKAACTRKLLFQQADGLAYAGGDSTLVVDLLEKSIKIEEQYYGKSSRNLLNAMLRLAEIHVSAGRISSADSVYERTIVVAEEGIGASDPYYVDILGVVINHYANSERPLRALELNDAAVTAAENVFGGTSVQYVVQRFNRGAILQRIGRRDEAIEIALECIRLEDSFRPDSSDHAIEWTSQLGIHFEFRNEHERAALLFADVLDRIEKSNLKLVSYWANGNRLSQSLIKQGLYSQAVEETRTDGSFHENKIARP